MAQISSRKVVTPKIIRRGTPKIKPKIKTVPKKVKPKKVIKRKKRRRKRASKVALKKVEEETLPEEVRWLEDDPHDNILSRFIGLLIEYFKILCKSKILNKPCRCPKRTAMANFKEATAAADD